MLACQKDKFSLPNEVSYLNCAYFSPLLNNIEAIGHGAISQKKTPYRITINDFFEPVTHLKKLVAKLVDADDYERIAIIPGVSYGVANAAKNILVNSNENIVVAEEQFPSNIYSWIKKTEETGASLKIIEPDKNSHERGKSWNQNILDAINDRTKIVAIANVHWADGTLFDLHSIRKQCDKFNACLIIDGSQSIGALPFSVKEIRPDALICAGYKWLLGPYSIGVAYYSEVFDNGEPIEECWINKVDSEDFKHLANYQELYKPKSYRYNVSESSNFILVPMLAAAIEQLLEWTPEAIQEYCYSISIEALEKLIKIGCQIEHNEYRANHLFGIRLGSEFDTEAIQQSLVENNVYVSFRGNAIRVAPHVYNTSQDFDKLVRCIEMHKKGL